MFRILTASWSVILLIMMKYSFLSLVKFILKSTLSDFNKITTALFCLILLCCIFHLCFIFSLVVYLKTVPLIHNRLFTFNIILIYCIYSHHFICSSFQTYFGFFFVCLVFALMIISIVILFNIMFTELYIISSIGLFCTCLQLYYNISSISYSPFRINIVLFNVNLTWELDNLICSPSLSLIILCLILYMF